MNVIAALISHLQHLSSGQPANVMGDSLGLQLIAVKLPNFIHDQARFRRLGVGDIDRIAAGREDMRQLFG